MPVCFVLPFLPRAGERYFAPPSSPDRTTCSVCSWPKARGVRLRQPLLFPELISQLMAPSISSHSVMPPFQPIELRERTNLDQKKEEYPENISHGHHSVVEDVPLVSNCGLP